MMKLNTWKTCTMLMYRGVVLYSLCGFAFLCLKMYKFESNESDPTFLYMLNSVNISIMIGCLMLLAGLHAFRKLVAASDVPAVRRLYIAAILNTLSAACALADLLELGEEAMMGMLGLRAILQIAAFIYMFFGAKKLQTSTALRAEARQGAEKLYKAMRLMLIGMGLAYIPLINSISMICFIIGFIRMMRGWGAIARAYR